MNTEKAAAQDAAPTMVDIEARALLFAVARKKLADKLDYLRRLQERVRARMIEDIELALAEFSAAHDVLAEAIEAAPELFAKPKTRTLHGIRVGWKKQANSLEIYDEANTIALIRAHMPESAAVLIKSEESPVRAALQALPAESLALIGAELKEGEDQPFIKPQDDALDKLISALLKDGRESKARAAVRSGS